MDLDKARDLLQFYILNSALLTVSSNFSSAKISNIKLGMKHEYLRRPDQDNMVILEEKSWITIRVKLNDSTHGNVANILRLGLAFMLQWSVVGPTNKIYLI